MNEKTFKITIEMDGAEPVVLDGITQYMIVGSGGPTGTFSRIHLVNIPILVGLATQGIEVLRMMADNERSAAIVNRVVAELAAVNVQLANRNGRLIEAP